MGDDGCVQNETKLKMSQLVGGVSILLFILSVVMIIFAVVSFSGMKPKKIGVDKYNVDLGVAKNAALAAVALVGGVLALLISICGCCTVKFQNPFVTCPFVICSFLIGLLCLIGGALVIGGKTQQAILQTTCRDPNPALNNMSGREVARKEYGAIVDTVMCSKDLCPCDNSNGQMTFWKAQTNETFLKTYRRSWTTGTDTPDRQNSASTETVKMSFAAAGAASKFNTYAECWDGKIKTMPATSKMMKNKYFKQAKDYLDKGGWAFLTDLEKNLNCAGLCATPLFYMTKPLSAGPPTQDCVNAFVGKFNKNTGMAVAAFLTAVVLICAGICAIPLCTGYNKNNEEE